MSIIIKSGNSNNLASVDSGGNVQVNLGVQDSELSGFAAMTSEVDSGSYTTSRLTRNAEITDDFRLRTGIDQTFFNEYFPGTTINGNIWNTLTTTMTITSASNFAVLNAGSSVASLAVAQLRTWRHMPAFMSYPVYCEIDLQLSVAPQTNNVVEWGLGLAATTATPTDGVFFRLSSGSLRAVLNTGGAEVLSAELISFLPTTGTTNDWLIVLSEKVVEYWLNDVLLATLNRQSTSGATTASMNLPIFIRNYNSAATSAAQVVRVGYVNVSQGDMNTGKPWPHIMAGSGNMAYQAQTGAAALGSAANYGNSVAAGAGAAMTNTTAALGTGLGGQFTALPTLTAGTDGIVCSVQIPAGTNAIPGKSLYITGVKIHGAVTAALTGGPVLYAYSLAYGHTSVSMATVEANGTVKAPRRIALGFETFAATSAVGILGSNAGCAMSFASPVVVQPGEFVAIAAKNLGTVTSAGTITFLVTFDAYFE